MTQRKKKGGRADSPWTGEELRAQLSEQPDEAPREQLRRRTRALVQAMPAPGAPRRKRARK